MILGRFTTETHAMALYISTDTPPLFTPRPGTFPTLCPNPLLDNGARFDNVVGNRFALIASLPLTKGQRIELDHRGAVVLSVKPGCELDRWLRRGRATAAIVRPDRTVMRAGRDTAALCNALLYFCPGD
ncbi:monooxygenase FAD-binding domain protein [Mycobacterium sp. MAC_011194_8550]|nr:monooxygenase FAD-binding domain protein [Mycobacterium sp. MAC_011194_8550]